MKQLLIYICLFSVSLSSTIAQSLPEFFEDNNPKLTKNESDWLNNNLKVENFDFTSKYIGFFELYSGGYWGIGKFTMSYLKKDIPTLDLGKYDYKIIVLDDVQKQTTRGYDALFVIAPKKIKGKLKRLDSQKLISEAKNRYPQIPIDAGIDNNNTLNYSNTIFLNEVYKVDLYPKTDYDFTGKKVAIIKTYFDNDKLEQVKISDYVDRIKSQLDLWGFSNTDHTYYLSQEQKIESGGYDVIIAYQTKKGVPLNYLIKFLKQNHGK